MEGGRGRVRIYRVLCALEEAPYPDRKKSLLTLFEASWVYRILDRKNQDPGC